MKSTHKKRCQSCPETTVSSTLTTWRCQRCWPSTRYQHQLMDAALVLAGQGRCEAASKREQKQKRIISQERFIPARITYIIHLMEVICWPTEISLLIAVAPSYKTCCNQSRINGLHCLLIEASRGVGRIVYTQQDFLSQLVSLLQQMFLLQVF